MYDLKTSVEETIIAQKPKAETQNKLMLSRKKNSPAQEELTGIRIRDVAEPKDKNPRFRCEHDLAVIQKIVSHLDVVADIGDIVLMSSFDEQKNQTLLRKIPNIRQGKFILSSASKLKKLSRFQRKQQKISTSVNPLTVNHLSMESVSLESIAWRRQGYPNRNNSISELMKETKAAKALLIVILHEDQRKFEKKKENGNFSDIQKYLRSLSKASPVPSEVYLDGWKAYLASEKANLLSNTYNMSFCCKAQTIKDSMLRTTDKLCFGEYIKKTNYRIILSKL